MSVPTASAAPTDPAAPAPGDIPAPADVAAAPADAEKTASGLASKVLKKGTGKDHPTAEDTVEVHYTGWMTNGKMFDSSVKRGQPAKFPLANVIPGWTEGLQLMPVGSEYKFFTPAKLADGEHGPPQIGPDATLIFDVTLISIDKAEAAIDWRQGAAAIERRLRAFDPFPGAAGVLAGETLKVWRAEPCAGAGRPGEVLTVGEAGIEVACGEGALRLIELQRPGGRRLPAAAFLQGHRVAPGMAFDTPAD